MKQWNRLRGDAGGYAVVEATILFPIMLMIFFALVLLAMYLPARASLQRSTQYAATALATERSDTWLRFDEGRMSYVCAGSKRSLSNVYASLIQSLLSGDDGTRAETIVRNLERQGVTQPPGELRVEYGVVNYIVYKEIVVTATRRIPMPVDLSFVGFPRELTLTVTSTAVVQNGDEFVRNCDLAADLFRFFDEKYNITSSGLFAKVGKVFQSFGQALGV